MILLLLIVLVSAVFVDVMDVGCSGQSSGSRSLIHAVPCRPLCQLMAKPG